MSKHLTGCAEAVSRVYPYLDGEANWIGRAMVRWHLRKCTRCEAAFIFEQHLKEKVHDGLAEECPQDVLDRLKLVLDVEKAPGSEHE